MSAKSSVSQHQLRESDDGRNSLADIIGQLRDIDPSRLSFSPFLDLDTQISLAPVSDSPESSVEELHSTEPEEDEKMSVNPAVEDHTETCGMGHVGGSRISVGQETLRTPEGVRKTVNEVIVSSDDCSHDAVIKMPSETSLLDAVQLPISATDPLEATEHLLPLQEHQPCLGEGAVHLVPRRCLEDRTCSGRGKCCAGCSPDHMKAVASAFVALLLAPWFVYGFYYFVPLQAPTCPDLASRITFALRCLLIAGGPILLGIMARAFSVLCLDSLDPLDPQPRPVLLHQLFVTGSVDQFAAFCLNVVVTATFLPQEHLRVVPILAGLFSVGRCCYWVSLHLCSAYCGFGSSLSFFPTLGLTVYNLLCLYRFGFGFLFMPAPAAYARTTPATMALELTVPKR